MAEKILIIDDDLDTLRLVGLMLQRQGYQITAATDGQQGLEKATNDKPNLILLDIMMPEMDGYEVCKKIRDIDSYKEVPVLFLTARSSEVDEVHGLNIGADDYIQKPASIDKIVARINANLRKTRSFSLPDNMNKIEAGPLVVDKERYQVILNGDELILPKKEFEILELLASKPGKVFSRNQILDSVWGEDIYVVARTIDVHVRKIREKLGDNSDLIETIKGVGYRFKKID